MKNKKFVLPVVVLLVILLIAPAAHAYNGKYYSVFQRINNLGPFNFYAYLNKSAVDNKLSGGSDYSWKVVKPSDKQDNVSQQPAEEPARQSADNGEDVDKEVPETNTGTQYQLTAREREMVEYVNEERIKAGLEPLQVDLELARVARIKSQDMVDNGYFSHNSPTYGSPFEMMKNFGIKYRSAGENIAMNSSVLKAHESLMNSEGHRNNILNKGFTHIGIGIVGNNGRSGITVTQMFISK